jgi:hypothetical protein
MYNEYIKAAGYGIAKNICGPRSTKLILCDPKVDNAEDIQKIIKIYDSKEIFFDTVIQTLEIDATLETQVGKHEFCWYFDFPDLPAEDMYSLNIYAPKFHIEI